MANRPEGLLRRTCGGQYGPLLTALMVLCLGAPGLAWRLRNVSILDAVMSCIVLTGIYATAPGQRSVVIGLTLAFISLASHQLFEFLHWEALHVLHYAFMIAILAYALMTILSAVIRDGVVTIETIKGALCVYLMMGVTWIYIFVVIDLMVPGSFRMGPAALSQVDGHLMVQGNLPRLLYFSFSTLTTLGYGDIVPLRAHAQTACYLEAVLGQIFLTVLVARLVGMHLSRPQGAGPSGRDE